MSVVDDEKQDNRVQVYLTEYETKELDRLREISGESKGTFLRKIFRLYIKGQLVRSTDSIW